MFFGCYGGYRPVSYAPSYTPTFGSAYQPTYVTSNATRYTPMAYTASPAAPASTGMFSGFGSFGPSLNNLLNQSFRLSMYAAQMQMTQSILQAFTGFGRSSSSSASASKTETSRKTSDEESTNKP